MEERDARRGEPRRARTRSSRRSRVRPRSARCRTSAASTASSDAGVTSETRSRTPRIGAAMRTGGRVMPLELFFDLVFVLGLTQCTALMADEPTWEGLVQGPAGARGAVVGVGRLRVADERRGPGGGGGAARAHRRDGGHARRRARDPARPSRTTGCCSPAASRSCASRTSSCSPSPRATTRSSGVRDRPRDQHRASASASSRPPRSRTVRCRAGSGSLALVLDMGGPALFGAEGWKLEPEHFAERHGLIVIIALGESIVAIGIGAEAGLEAGERRRRGTRRGYLCGAVVAVLRRRGARRRAAPGARGARPRAQRDRAGLLLVPAPADGRRHRAARARLQEDARARRRRR